MEAEGDWAFLLHLPRLQHMVVEPIASSEQEFYYVRGGKGQAQSHTSEEAEEGPAAVATVCHRGGIGWHPG